LQARWKSLHDLDRAEAVKIISRTGKSIRSIAKHVKLTSETYLRMLLTAAKAPAEDLILARQGEINTRELARRALAKHTDPELRARVCKKWTTSICRWLQESDFAWSQQYSILDESRREMMMAELDGFRKSSSEGEQLAEIIERNRPNDMDENVFAIAFYARWLARWMLDAVPADLVDTALVQAIQKTAHEEWVIPKSHRN